MYYKCVYYCDTYLQTGHPLHRLRGHTVSCIEYIGVVSVYNQYNYVYYCDTCDLPGAIFNAFRKNMVKLSRLYK
jgi:hypothetical protein